MPTKTNKSKTNKRDLTKKSPRVSWRNGIIVIGLAVIAGFIIAGANAATLNLNGLLAPVTNLLNSSNLSTASTGSTPPTSTQGKKDWRGTNEYQKAAIVYSKSGDMCVSTTFDSYNSPFSYSYNWHIEQKRYDQKTKKWIWVDMWTSNTFSANGNLDQQCWPKNYLGAGTGDYQVKFHPTESGRFIHGDYQVFGTYKGWSY